MEKCNTNTSSIRTHVEMCGDVNDAAGHAECILYYSPRHSFTATDRLRLQWGEVVCGDGGEGGQRLEVEVQSGTGVCGCG